MCQYLAATVSHATIAGPVPTLNAVDPAFMPVAAVRERQRPWPRVWPSSPRGRKPADRSRTGIGTALVGIKPTFALVPNAGVMPLAEARATSSGRLRAALRDARWLSMSSRYSEEDPKRWRQSA